MLSQRLWREVQEQARVQGISASQFIREAVIAMLFYERGRSGRDGPGQVKQLAREDGASDSGSAK